MMLQPQHSKFTKNHEAIKEWVEERGGKPIVEENEEITLLIDFDKKNKEKNYVSWNDFFEDFDEEQLMFLYQDKTPEGETSYYYRFVPKRTR